MAGGQATGERAGSWTGGRATVGWSAGGRAGGLAGGWSGGWEIGGRAGWRRAGDRAVSQATHWPVPPPTTANRILSYTPLTSASQSFQSLPNCETPGGRFVYIIDTAENDIQVMAALWLIGTLDI